MEQFQSKADFPAPAEEVYARIYVTDLLTVLHSTSLNLLTAVPVHWLVTIQVPPL